MPKPDNLEFAFPIVDSTIVADHALVAYRITGTPTDLNYNYWTTDSVLVPGQDLADGDPADGDGSVGQYVVFGWQTGHVIPAFVSEAAVTEDLGWDPFDPVNWTPTSVRYWELQPGSDVMATTLDGIGPVAITDENAGGVIGDIAYVVSGYVYNDTLSQQEAADNLEGNPVFKGYAEEWTEPVAVVVGDIYSEHRASPNLLIITSADPGTTFDWDTDHLTVPTGAATQYPYHALSLAGEGMNGDYCWPYLERFNLATGEWLPRIPMPHVTKTVEFSSTTEVVNGYTTMTAGPYVFEEGELPISGPGDRVQVLLNPFVPSDEYAGSSEATVPFPAGTYLVIAGGEQDAGAPPTTAEELATSLGGVAITEPLTYDYGAYAAEGGFAGVIDGKLYFGGGDGNYITGKELFVYDPATEEFTRLDDVPGDYGPDYNPFGVITNKVWAFFPGVPSSVCYEPDAGWTEPVVDYGPENVNNMGNDQVQGIEIDGKLYFVYDRVYVFDPVALTVEAKAELSGFGQSPPFGVALRDGQIIASHGDISRLYDPIEDTWAEISTPGGVSHQYSVVVEDQDVPYILSGVDSAWGRKVVWGLTGNQPEAASGPPVIGGALTVVGGTLSVVP